MLASLRVVFHDALLVPFARYCVAFKCLVMDVIMADTLDSIVGFIKALPWSASDVEPQDYGWVLAALQDPELPEKLTIKMVTETVALLGTPILLRPTAFLQLLHAALAVFFELDSLVPVCFHTSGPFLLPCPFTGRCGHLYCTSVGVCYAAPACGRSW